MHAPVHFERYEVRGHMRRVPEEVMESVKRNKVCLKGGLATPVGGGVSSLNMQLRKELDIFASLVNCINVPGLVTRHENVDIVVIRENTEGEYAGLEHEVVPGVVESLKVTKFLIVNRLQMNYFEPNSSSLVIRGKFIISPSWISTSVYYSFGMTNMRPCFRVSGLVVSIISWTLVGDIYLQFIKNVLEVLIFFCFVLGLYVGDN